MTLRVLDPRLEPEEGAARLAAPLPTLEGTVIGLLDNAKIGTARLYDHLAALLSERHGVREVLRRRKPDTSRPVPEAMLGELLAADAIVSGVGD
jgi:hypothetical protein